MKATWISLSAALVLLGTGLSAPVQAAVLDRLLDKLRDKGVLSEQEAQEIRAEARAEEQVKEAAKTPAAGAAPTDLAGRFSDGFALESADKQHSIALTARLQTDYRAFSPSGPAGTSETANTFNVRRALLGIKGKIFNDIGYELIGDFAPSAANLDTAYLNFGWLKNAQLRVGYFAPPFNLENITSSGSLDFTERSLPSNLIPTKELGAMVHGAPLRGFTYALAAINGSGSYPVTAETDTAKDGKEVIGRVTMNFGETMGQKDLVAHLGLAYSYGSQPPGAMTGAFRTEGRGTTFFTGRAPAGGADFDRTRQGVEFALATGPFKLQAEWVQAKFDGNGFDRKLDTYYVSGLWAITGERFAEAYRNGVFGQVKPRQAFAPGGGAGAWVVGLRYSRMDAGDFASGTFTGTNGAHATTVGLKWLPNNVTAFMLNLVRTRFDAAVGGRDDETALNLRAQVSW